MVWAMQALAPRRIGGGNVMRLLNRGGVAALSLLATCLFVAGAAYAQEKKDEEPPFWA